MMKTQLKIVGYITSDTLNDGFIAHNLQNMTIHAFLKDMNQQYLLSWTEFKNRTPFVFNSLLCESFYDGICFYSIEQLNHFPGGALFLKELAAKNIWIGFAREKIFFHGENNLEKVSELYWLKQWTNKKENQMENAWWN